MNKYLLAATVAVTLGGCVSQNSHTNLQSTVYQLQQTVSALKAELSEVKQQRVVRMPTGAPTYTQPRTSTGAMPNQQYDQAMQLYKMGDVAGALNAFEQFVLQNPSSSMRPQALYYLAQSAYSQRSFVKAQQALEALVMQPGSAPVAPSAIELLKKTYSAQGKNTALKQLDSFLSAKQTAASTEGAVVNPAAAVRPVRPTL